MNARDPKAIETAFALVVDRAPTDEEKLYLHRLAASVQYHQDDSFWSVLFSQRFMLTLMQDVPRQIQGAALTVLGSVREEARRCAEREVAMEVARVRDLLAEAVGKAGIAVAEKQAAVSSAMAVAQASKARRSAWWWASAGTAVFMAVCMVCGASLAGGSPPPWLGPEGRGSAAYTLLSAVVRAPAGVVAAAMLLPVLLPALRQSWREAGNEDASRGDRLRAALRLTLAAIGTCTCLACVGIFMVWR